MKHTFAVAIALFTCLVAFSQQKEERKALNVVEVNVYSPRTSFISYSNINNAFADDFTLARNTINLNGDWKFSMLENYETLKIDRLLKSRNNFSSWKDITIPGGWKLEPNSNIVIDSNSVCIYKKHVEIPINWLDKDVFFTLGEAKSAAYLYINGKKIGYNKNSKFSAEYEITDYLNIGIRNEIAIILHSNSDGLLLESGAEEYQTGIFGDTYIMAQPKIRINDYLLNASVDKSYKNGLLDISIEVSNSYNNAQTVLVGYDIINDDGNIVTYNNRKINIKAGASDTVNMSSLINNAKIWSAENPNLYTILFRVAVDGRQIEYFSAKFGFRNIKITDKQLTINGKPLKIKGVNYSNNGNIISEDSLRNELSLMKLNGINAIKTTNNPQQPIFYKLCNKYGFYVFDEANINTKQIDNDKNNRNSLSNSPQWYNVYLTRVKNMYQRNKNYTCITVWSLGSDFGNGYNQYKTYQYLKNSDTIRPVQYHGANKEWNNDIYSPRIISSDSVVQDYLFDMFRPTIFSEFTGNSADLKKIWHQVTNNKALQGGFMINWSTESKNKMTLSEFQPLFQALEFEDVDMDRGKLRVINNSMFDNLTNYSIVYEIHKEGNEHPLAKGYLKTPVIPQSSRSYQIPIRVYVPMADRYNYFVRFFLKSKNIYGVEPNSVFATGEIRVPVKKIRKNYLSRGIALDTVRTRTALSLFNSNVNISFKNISGAMIEYKVGGVNYINSENPSLIDVIYGDENLYINSVAEVIYPKFTTLIIDYILQNKSKIEITYKVYNSGIILVTSKYISTNGAKAEFPIEIALNLPSSWREVICERKKIRRINSDFEIKDISYLGISDNSEGMNSLLLVADDNLMDCSIIREEQTKIIVSGNQFTIVPMSSYSNISIYSNLRY